jgi:aminoglycoside phosphotransferase (APT) family kinase protein
VAWEWTPETLQELERFLGSKGLTDGPLTARVIGEGHSNLTFLVSDGIHDVVLRRPPPPPIPPGANDMLREARVLAALRDTTVPVPALLATAQEGEVIDVAFYVMSFAPGPVVTTTTPSPLDDATVRRDIGWSLVDTLADLHAVDFRDIGLGDFGRPAGFNTRHLQRMRRLVTDEDGAPPAEFADVEAWLVANTPAESGAALIHNDFRIGNVVLAPEPPGRVDAVLDWELATLGDPLLDVGYFLATVPEAGQPMNPTAALSAALLEPGYPDRSEMAARYHHRTGRDLSNLAWYTTFALWKLAVLYEYSRRRVLDGIGDPYYADPGLVAAFLADARCSAGLDEPAPATNPR